MCHATSFMRTRDLWCNRLGKVSNFTGSNALFSIPSANLRFLTFLALKFWFRASENVKWKSRNVVGFVSLTGWWAVTINESLPFGISLPLPAIIEIPLPALSSPVSRTPPAPCSPGLPPPCPPPLVSNTTFSTEHEFNPDYFFRYSLAPGNFPLEWPKKSWSIYFPTEFPETICYLCELVVVNIRFISSF